MELTMRLTNDVTIVTGAGRGIGREMALLFAAEGARVVVADLNDENARRVAAQINALGGEAFGACMDVTDPAQVQRLIDETVARFGKLDVLVNNAGVGLNKPFLTTTLPEWEGQLRVNLTGTF